MVNLRNGTRRIRKWEAGEITIISVDTLVGATIVVVTANGDSPLGTVTESAFRASSFISPENGGKRAYFKGYSGKIHNVEFPLGYIAEVTWKNGMPSSLAVTVYITQEFLRNGGTIECPEKYMHFEERINAFLTSCVDSDGNLMPDTSVQMKRAKRDARIDPSKQLATSGQAPAIKTSSTAICTSEEIFAYGRRLEEIEARIQAAEAEARVKAEERYKSAFDSLETYKGLLTDAQIEQLRENLKSSEGKSAEEERLKLISALISEKKEVLQELRQRIKE